MFQDFSNSKIFYADIFVSLKFKILEMSKKNSVSLNSVPFLTVDERIEDFFL